jgi:flavin-dependent dehydrogenase
MAAITLARAGVVPTLLDRDEVVGDALCGGFLSWRTAERLRAVGMGPMQLGAHPVETLALVSGRTEALAPLPSPGFGLSRRALDAALRRRAVGDGARLVIDRARTVVPGRVEGEAREYLSDAIFLASGKHDVRGSPRPRPVDDPALGLRLRIPPNGLLRAILRGRIELHLFRGGYAGIVLQEDGSANVCLAIRKRLLADADGRPRVLLDRLAATNPLFAERMAFAPVGLPIDSIGSVPYGYVARETEMGLWRLGDQAAVIPSLAGEGIAIAMESGALAAQAFLGGRKASDFQREFAGAAARPVRIAKVIWQVAETSTGARLLAGVARNVPALARAVMAMTRI